MRKPSNAGACPYFREMAGERPLCQWITHRLEGVTDDMFLQMAPGATSPADLPVHRDVDPGGGPKSGIHGALLHARHPRTGRLYTEMVYQPMLELLETLRANDFRTYIVSGGGIEFMRAWVEDVYGIPPEQVIGSSIETKFEMRESGPVLVRIPKVDFLDDNEGKPVGIHKFIGRCPILAFGNSDGDHQMLQWTAAGDGTRLMGLVHHTDADREWAYDRDSMVGRLDKALDEAQEKGWTVVDMAREWRLVYPWENENKR